MATWRRRISRSIALAALLCACAHTGTGSDGKADAFAQLEQLDDPARDAWAMPDRVVAELPIHAPDADVADIGAGSGYFARRIAHRVPDGVVWAIDVDVKFKHFIEEHRDAWGTPNIRTRLSLYEHPLLPEASLDLVFMSNTYTYIEDKRAYFDVLRRALRPGGAIVIVEFRPDAQCTPAMGCPPGASRSSSAKIAQTLAACGLRMTRSETFLPLQYFLVFEPA